VQEVGLARLGEQRGEARDVVEALGGEVGQMVEELGKMRGLLEGSAREQEREVAQVERARGRVVEELGVVVEELGRVRGELDGVRGELLESERQREREVAQLEGELRQREREVEQLRDASRSQEGQVRCCMCGGYGGSCVSSGYAADGMCLSFCVCMCVLRRC